MLFAAAAALCFLFTGGTQAQIAPAAGYWWNPAEGGRGFVIEIQGTQMFMAGFLYAANGEATWVASSGPMASPSQFSGPLITDSGGQTLTGAYKGAPTSTTPLGAITINFSSNTQATLAWPGGTIPIQRFDFGPGGASAQQNPANPQTGWWWNAGEGGRGFAIELQGGSMYFAGYMYDASGNPTWYLASGNMTNPTLFQGQWQQYGGGQTLTGVFRPASVINAAAGAVTLQISDPSDATLTLPDGRQIPLTRFNFGAGNTPYTLNVQPVTVDSGPANNDANVPFISITICAPGTSNCQTIDHIDVDTGSSGLRIISSVLSPSLNLVQQTDASGRPVVECTQFADGYAWGPVKLADLSVSGEQARSLPMQVIGDPSFPIVPGDCSNTGPAETTVAGFGANGIIGVGNFQADCGSACAGSPVSGVYYVCPASGCSNAAVANGAQVQNPVGLFPMDNNGVLLQMASVPAPGAATVTGSLIFGIGTQSNNGLGGATVLDVDPNTGYLTAVINNTNYVDSLVDSGASAFFLPQGFTLACTSQQASGYFCPSGTLIVSAVLQGVSGVSAPATFTIANAESLFNANPAFSAFGNIGAINSDPAGIDFGLPFFFGRSVFTAIEGKQTPGGAGPYIAF
jgi:hypothetical protein